MIKLKVATVGAGHFSQFHHDAWSRMRDVALTAACDLDIDKARAFAKRWGVPAVYTNAEEMLDGARPDLLDIITHSESHLPLIRMAAERNVAVLCQTPFCASIAEAEEAIALAETARSLLVVHDSMRFQPWHQEIGRLLTEGRVGYVYQAVFRFRPGDGRGLQAYLDRRAYLRKMDRFLIRETATHFIDLFRLFFGEPGSVFARLARLNPAIVGEDFGLVAFAMENGAQILFDGNRLADHPAEDRRLTMGEFLIEGSEGALRLDGDGRLFFRPFFSNEETEHVYSCDRSAFGGDCVFRLQRHVVDHIRGGGPIANLARDYVINQRVAEAVYRSAASGTTETIV